jgi:hypothetical protein
MRLSITKWPLPLPDEAVEIRNNTTPFLYQWYAGESVLKSIWYGEETYDPLDEVPYTYLLSNNKKDFQLLGFLEKYNEDVITQITSKAYALENYSQRYPNVFGKKLWTLLAQDTNTPLQEIPEYKLSWYIDLQDTTTNLFDAYVSDTYLISWKESDLIGIIPYTTCKKLFENGSNTSGFYNINPTWLNPVEVYCNMTLGWGGWTLVGRSTVSWNGSGFWWFSKEWNIRNDNSVYSLGEDIKSINFTEVLAATYTSAKTIDQAISFWVSKNFIKDESNYNSREQTQWCNEVNPVSGWASPCDLSPQAFWTWGWFKDDGWLNRDMFVFRNISAGQTFQATWLAKWWFQYSGWADEMGVFNGKQGMIFVR